jgi:hypothetical protein
MVVPPSDGSDGDSAISRRLVGPDGRYINRDVLVEPGYNLGDSEGSRGFVRFAKEYSFALMPTTSAAEVVSTMAILMETWNEIHAGRFLERPSGNDDKESERVPVSKTDALIVAMKCFFGLRKAAKKQGPKWMHLLLDPTDQSVVDAFWKDNNDAVAAAK